MDTEGVGVGVGAGGVGAGSAMGALRAANATAAGAGTVVAGGNVQIGEVNISQGNLNVVISTKFQVSQPTALIRPGANISTVVVPDTELTVEEGLPEPVQLEEGATVGDLVQALNKVKLSTREVITVLQAIKQAGALHAELIIQ